MYTVESSVLFEKSVVAFTTNVLLIVTTSGILQEKMGNVEREKIGKQIMLCNWQSTYYILMNLNTYWHRKGS